MNAKLTKGNVGDIRTPEKFSEGIYPNVMSIPLDQVSRKRFYC